MSKNGQAKVLSTGEFNNVLENIKQHRHPAKNTLIIQLIIQLIFKLGFRAQELSLLRIREVASLGAEFYRGYDLKDVLILPKSFTKGAKPKTDASYDKAPRTSVRFDVDDFDRLVNRIAGDVRKGKEILPSEYYPPVRKRNGKSRELPITDLDLIAAIEGYLDERVLFPKKLRPHDPLILSQKGGAYSSNTLQGHISKMLR